MYQTSVCSNSSRVNNLISSVKEYLMFKDMPVMGKYVLASRDQ